MKNNIIKSYEAVDEVLILSHNDRFNGNCVSRINGVLAELRKDKKYRRGYKTISVSVTDIDSSDYRTITICFRYKKEIKKENKK